MDGTVLHFDAADGGLIRGSDGQRYSFAVADWKGETRPGPGQNVDFEIDNGAARSVYPLPVQPEAPAPTPAAETPRIGPFLADRPGLPFAATILVACMLPFVSLGFVSPNLFDLVSITSMINNFPIQMEGGVQAALYLYYLLYLIPLLAILVVVQELRRASQIGLRVGVGLFCLAAPFAISILSGLLIGARRGGPDFNLISHISLGWILIAAASLGLIALGFGWAPFGEGSGDDPGDDF